MNPVNEHEHVWGDLESSRFAGTVHRKCTVDGRRFVKALEDDEQPGSEFVNLDTGLVVLDIVDADERGGREVYRSNVNRKVDES